MNAIEAIAEINHYKLNPPNLDELVSIISHAAVIDKNAEAIYFMWLCHWRPYQTLN